jgi:hypothetical protein
MRRGIYVPQRPGNCNNTLRVQRWLSFFLVDLRRL